MFVLHEVFGYPHPEIAAILDRTPSCSPATPPSPSWSSTSTATASPASTPSPTPTNSRTPIRIGGTPPHPGAERRDPSPLLRRGVHARRRLHDLQRRPPGGRHLGARRPRTPRHRHRPGHA
ncbi:hypothetical protein ACFHW2_39810 [Actinomadura sp. LOL_016]|uniref:hypothetical protein n=1 Tax=unclassified Actinomadura TaxID=2626254 RepID=UPI003A803231